MEHISVTQLGTYLTCRLKYHLWKEQTKEEREADATEAMLRGRELHTRIENFYRLAPAKRPTAGTLERGAADEDKMWHHFLTRFGQDEEVTPTHIEMPLKAIIIPACPEHIAGPLHKCGRCGSSDDGAGVELVGYADHVTINQEDQTIQFAEHKTSGRKMNLRQTAYYSFQPLVYQWLLGEMYPGYTVLDVTYTGLWPNGADRVVRQLFDLGSWPGYFKLLAKEMMSNPEPIPTGMAIFPTPCSWCQFKSYCEEKILMGSVEEDNPD